MSAREREREREREIEREGERERERGGTGPPLTRICRCLLRSTLNMATVVSPQIKNSDTYDRDSTSDTNPSICHEHGLWFRGEGLELSVWDPGFDVRGRGFRV